MENNLREKIINILLQDKKKEYLCHIQFVSEIAMRLAKDFDVDRDVIEAACLLHDIGRGKELDGEDHPQAGRRMAEEILFDTNFSAEQKEKIYACILSHNSEEVPESLEEQIVRSADGGTKVEYHEAFMLMCKKETYEERLVWGMKYLEKGYANISLEKYKKEIEQKFFSIDGVYKKIAEMI